MSEDKAEKDAIMSLLQIRKAPASPSGDEGGSETNEGPPKKKRKAKGEEVDEDEDVPAPTQPPARTVSGASTDLGIQDREREKEQTVSAVAAAPKDAASEAPEGGRLLSIHEAILAKRTAEAATAAATKEGVSEELPSDLRRLQLERELALRSMEKSPLEQEMALRAALEKSALEKEIALRSLGSSDPVERELALRALERNAALSNASLADVNAFANPFGAAGPLAMAQGLFPSTLGASSGLLGTGLLQQQRARQMQMENAMLRAQLAAVEQQRLGQLALLGVGGSSAAAAAGLSAAGLGGTATTTAAALPPVPGAPAFGRQESLPQVPGSVTSAAAAAGERPISPPDISKDKIKPAMRPTNEAKKPENQRLCTRTKFRYEHYTPPSSWSELTDVPKVDHVPADDDMKHPIEVAGEHDVLFGRGGATNMHPGNVNFRNLVQKYRAAYCTVPKGDKGALARFLCNYVRAKNGRFLRQDPSNKKWYEVGDEKAICKCGQALREGSAEFLKTKGAGPFLPQAKLPSRLAFLGGPDSVPK